MLKAGTGFFISCSIKFCIRADGCVRGKQRWSKGLEGGTCWHLVVALGGNVVNIRPL